MAARTHKAPTPRRARLISRGGSLPVITIGRPRAWLGDMYVRLLDASWRRLALLLVILYLSINLLFACAYLEIGDGVENAHPGSFADMFFFSVQTFATIGYGKLSPVGLAANLLVTLEAMLGFAFFAVVTGLVFSKFSRPTSRVLFSNRAVICPYDGVPHLMLRLANERGNRIVDAHIQLVLLRNEVTKEGHRMRRFHDLTPVRGQVPVMQLTWTAMHPIDERSPLFGMSVEALHDSEAEIIVSLTGLDETLAQTIHARFSYIAEEVIFDAAFEDILIRREDQQLEVHYHRFHEVRPLSAAGEVQP